MITKICWRLALAVIVGWGLGPLKPHMAGAQDEVQLVLYPFVWRGFQEYLGLKYPSAFAVSRDGSIYGYSYCQERRCVFNQSKRLALKSCEENGGEDCVIFAVKQDIRLPYRVIDLTATGACPKTPVAKVTIVADVPPPVHEHGLDIAELTHLEKIGKARTDWRAFEVMGLHMPEFDVMIEDDLRPDIRETDGLVCAGLAESEIRVRMSVDILVASDFPESSCLYKEVLAHEMRHYEVARRLFIEFADEATRRLGDDLRSRPFLAVADPWEGRAATQARVEEAIEAAFLAFLDRYEAEQGAIDTDAEYARVTSACPDADAYLH